MSLTKLERKLFELESYENQWYIFANTLDPEAEFHTAKAGGGSDDICIGSLQQIIDHRSTWFEECDLEGMKKAGVIENHVKEWVAALFEEIETELAEIRAEQERDFPALKIARECGWEVINL